jgi:hypothetical protein
VYLVHARYNRKVRDHHDEKSAKQEHVWSEGENDISESVSGNRHDNNIDDRNSLNRPEQ